MEKIVTHPLYIRCKKVIASCNNPSQIKIAKKYCRAVVKNLSYNFYKKSPTFWQINDFEFRLLVYFEDLYNMAHKKQLELERSDGIR
jgi:spore germination protein YaaH